MTVAQRSLPGLLDGLAGLTPAGLRRTDELDRICVLPLRMAALSDFLSAPDMAAWIRFVSAKIAVKARIPSGDRDVVEQVVRQAWVKYVDYRTAGRDDI